MSAFAERERRENLLLMCGMRSIPFHVFRFLQDGHNSHVKSFGPVRGDRQRRAGVELQEAYETAVNVVLHIDPCGIPTYLESSLPWLCPSRSSEIAVLG